MDFLKDIVKEIGGEYTQLASDIDETETFVDTGSYIFNALVSGSIFGGVSGNKITAISGETSTGKTFFSLAVVKNFLDNNPTGYCLYFDTEAAITRSLLESRGIDTTRVVVVNVVTVEEFRGKALKAVDLYLKKPEGERNACMFVLDSLGMLSTSKEINDALNDKEVRDMTKSQLIKGAFRGDGSQYTNNQTNNVDFVIPCNNKGRKSLGIIFYLLAKIYLESKGLEMKYKLEDFTED